MLELVISAKRQTLLHSTNMSALLMPCYHFSFTHFENFTILM